MVEQVDTPDLKSCGQQWPCGFDSRSEYDADEQSIMQLFIHVLYIAADECRKRSQLTFCNVWRTDRDGFVRSRQK